MAEGTFDQAIDAIRAGADYSLCGRTLTAGGVTLMGLTDEEFDIAYDTMDEMDGSGEDVISLA